MLKKGGSSRALAGCAEIEVERRVLDLVAETSGVERASLSLGMPLSAALDSLTLAAVVARIEAAFELGFSSEEASNLLGARDLGELCRIVAARVGRANESRRNHRK